MPYSPGAQTLSAEARAGLLEDASDAGPSAYGPDAVLHAFPHTGAGPLPNSPMPQLFPADLGAGPVNYAPRAGLCGHGADTMLPCPMGPPEVVHMTTSLCMPPMTHEATFHQHPGTYSNSTSFEASPMAIQSFPYYSDMVCQIPNVDSMSNPAWSHAAEASSPLLPFPAVEANCWHPVFHKISPDQLAPDLAASHSSSGAPLTNGDVLLSDASTTFEDLGGCGTVGGSAHTS